MSNSAPRTLADQFRNWSDEQLAELLQHRPDLATPTPQDSRQLASRVVDRRSVIIALDDLNAFELLVLQALSADTKVPAESAAIESATNQLIGRGLVWGEPAQPTSIVRELMAGSSDLLALPESQQVLLQNPPGIAASERELALVDRVAAGAGFEFVRRTELLLDRWGTHPPAALRAGGLGVRDLKAAAELLHVEPSEAALIIETAHAAGLLAIGMTDELDQAWLPTDRFDTWLASDTSQRWQVLANGWLTSDRLIAAIGGRAADKPINALTPDLARHWVAELRMDALRQLPSEPGEVLAATTGLPSLLARLRWFRPRRPAMRVEQVPALLREAAAIGVTGLDGLSTLGRALLEERSGDRPPSSDASTIEALFPAPIDHVLIQADNTAVAPGPLQSDLARKLALVADIESRGGATVYRFATDSVRRAFDAGWSATEVHDFLADISRTPVPQSLTYLIDDVARRFGTLRVGHAESFLRSDDETALTELVHHPAATSLRLRRIAPTVVITDVPLSTVLPRLRELGLAPVVEAPDGSVRVARPDVSRARNPKSSRIGSARAAARTAATVAAIRAGDRVARPAQAASTGPADVIAHLRAAGEARQEIAISYVGNDGTISERLVVPLKVEGGQVTAYDSRSDMQRTFAVHRITQARSL